MRGQENKTPVGGGLSIRIKLLSPFAVVIVLTLVIFIVELLIMFFERYFNMFNAYGADIFDATVLALIVNPVLYLMVYKPLMSQVEAERKLVEQISQEKNEIEERDELLRLVNEITVAANESTTIEEGLTECLTKICIFAGWQVGHAFKPIYEGGSVTKLISYNVWYLQEPKRFERLKRLTQITPLPRGEGLPWRVFFSHEPIWITNLEGVKGLPRLEQLRKENSDIFFKGAFVFPVMAGDKNMAVLEFLTESAKEPDPLLMDLISSVTLQLGRVMERKETEIALRTLSNAVEQATESFFMTDPDGKIEYVNPAFERTSGYSKAEVMGRNPRFLASEKHSSDYYGDMWNTIKSGSDWSGMIVNRKKSGDLFDVEMTITPVKDETGVIRHFVAISRDVSEKKNLQNQLMQAEKMFTVGTFVSGVAHELNNPLTAILGFSQRLAARGDDFPPNVKHQLEIIGEQSKRAVKIVQNLLKFSRKTPAATIFCNINEVIDNTLLFHEYGFRSDNITVVKNFKQDPLLVKGDVSQLQQVFTNIMLNAQYEMKKANGQGVLSITTDCTENMARVEIENDGPPIPPDVKSRLFDPFYSTKTADAGTGLGLYITYSIITDHRGKIWVETPGESGARFVITLPLIEGEVAEQTIPEELKTWKISTKKILVVEDEEFIRSWLKEILEENGAKVTAAKEGGEAIEFMRSEKFDLVISDIKMKGKSGYELGEWLVEKKPEYRRKFLVITGVIDIEVSRFCEKHGFRLLQKPFGVNDLLTTMREMAQNRPQETKNE
jgi:PAS domain S-box-containing protein